MIASNGDLETISQPESATWTDRVLGSNFNAQEAASRLRTAIDRVGGNKGVMAKTGIPSRTLSAYLAGGDMKRTALVALAKACDVNVAWLATGEGPMTGESQSQTQSFAPSIKKPVSALDALDADRLRRSIEAALEAFAEQSKVPDPHSLARVTLIVYAAFTRDDENVKR